MFVFVVLRAMKRQKEAVRKTAVPGEFVTFWQSATIVLICKMDVDISKAHVSVALKQLEAQLYCAVLQLRGPTEHDGSAPPWLCVSSPTANPLNVTQHAPAEALKHVFPASFSFCSGY